MTVATWCQYLDSRQKHVQVLKYKLYVIIFMQDIYNYIPETNHISKVYSVAAVL
jgi:hypothetical protein